VGKTQPTNRSLFRMVGRQPQLFSLMLLSAFAAMGAIVMTPALPSIASHFGTRIGTTQLSVTSFLWGYAFGQLIYGPLANRFGRKFALHTGIFIATLGTIFSLLSSPIESFSLLIFGRFIEAVGASSGLAISFTIINDFYFEKEARKILGALMLAFAIVPGIATAVGGVLVQYFNWNACFYFLLFYGLFLFYLAHLLPETLREKDFNAMHHRYILERYKSKFMNKKLIGYAMIAGFSGACTYVFGAEGPFIGIHMLKFQPAIYGMLGLLPYFGTFLGSIMAMFVSAHDEKLILLISFSLEFIAALLMFFLFLLNTVSLWTMLIPMGLFSVGHAMLCATAISLSTRQDNDKANTSAVSSFTMMCMPVLMTFVLSVFHAANAIIMPSIFLVSLMLMGLTYFYMIKDT